MRDLVFLVWVCTFVAIDLGSQTSAEPLLEQRNIENGTNASAGSSVQQRAADGHAPTVILSRFSFQRVDEGLLRLDGQTGEIILCSSHKGDWSCEAVPENHAALEKESKLENETAELRAEVLRLKAELAETRSARQLPSPPAESPRPNDGRFKQRINNNVEHLRATIENVWHRMVSMLTSFQKDTLHTPLDHAAL
jgi:hypothetical protein